MRIFRIENDDRVGFIWGKMKYHLPYELEYDYIRDDIKDKNGIMTERRQQPDADYGTPLADAYFNNLIYKGSPLIFGFASIKDIYTWVSPATIGILELNEFYIHVYDVPEEQVIKGSRQVAFDPVNSVHRLKISHKQLRRGLR